MKKPDEFGDRMKSYETVETARNGRDGPIIVRLDGRGFSRITSSLMRPDYDFMHAMQETAKRILKNSGAQVAYTQSDEITLVMLANEGSSLMFDGKFQKLASVLASQTSLIFNEELTKTPSLGHLTGMLPHFDARAFSVPNKEEAANAVLWRIMDASKNSISMLAREHFSHKALQGKSGPEMVAMMAEKNIDYSTFPESFRYGTIFKSIRKNVELTEDQRMVIPPAHRPPEGQLVERKIVEALDVMPFHERPDRVDVIFA